MYVFALLLQSAFSLNQKVSFDVRAQAMNTIKSRPLSYLIPNFYPNLHALHMLTERVSDGVQIIMYLLGRALPSPILV